MSAFHLQLDMEYRKKVNNKINHSVGKETKFISDN